MRIHRLTEKSKCLFVIFNSINDFLTVLVFNVTLFRTSANLGSTWIIKPVEWKWLQRSHVIQVQLVTVSAFLVIKFWLAIIISSSPQIKLKRRACYFLRCVINVGLFSRVRVRTTDQYSSSIRHDCWFISSLVSRGNDFLKVTAQLLIKWKCADRLLSNFTTTRRAVLRHADRCLNCARGNLRSPTHCMK